MQPANEPRNSLFITASCLTARLSNAIQSYLCLTYPVVYSTMPLTVYELKRRFNVHLRGCTCLADTVPWVYTVLGMLRRVVLVEEH